MSKSNTAENAVLDVMYKDTDLPWKGQTNLYAALFTADPGEAGSIANEAAFAGYARATVNRSTGITLSGSQVSNTNTISFPECTGGSEVISHVAFITTASGAGTILHKGSLSASRNVSAGITLQFAAGTFTVTED